MAKDKDLKSKDEKPKVAPPPPTKGNTDSAVLDSKPEEPGAAIAIPDGFRGTMKLTELPNPLLHGGTNIRSFTVQPGESQEAAILRSWNITPEFIENFLASPPGTMDDLKLGEWDNLSDAVKAFDDVDPEAIQPFKVADKTVYRAWVDGNCRYIVTFLNQRKHPGGYEAKFLIPKKDNPKEMDEVKLLKKFEELPVKVYRNLNHAQVTAIQTASDNKEGFSKADIAARLLTYIRQRPGQRNLKGHLLNVFGAKVIAKVSKAQRFEQELERAAYLPIDVGTQYIAYLRGDKVGDKPLAGPNNGDLRDMYPDFKLKFISWEGGDMAKGCFYTPLLAPAVQTFDEIMEAVKPFGKGVIESVLDEKGKVKAQKWLRCSHQPKAGEAGCTCVEATSTVECYKLWTGIKVRQKGTRTAGGAAKLEGPQLSTMQNGFQQFKCPFLATLVGAIRGDTDSKAQVEPLIDFGRTVETTFWRLVQEHDKPFFDACLKALTAIMAGEKPALPQATVKPTEGAPAA